MSRPLRIEFAGGLYHVTSRGDGREAIFLAEEDRPLFLGVLSQVEPADLEGREAEIVTDRASKTPNPVTGDRIGAEAMTRGLSMNIVKIPAMGAVFRIAPPLTATDEEIDLGLSIMSDAITAATR